MGTKDRTPGINRGIVDLNGLEGDLADYLGKMDVPNRAFLVDTSVLLEAASPYARSRKPLAQRTLWLLSEAITKGVDGFITPTILEECFFKLIRWCYPDYARRGSLVADSKRDRETKVDYMAFADEAARGVAWDKLYKHFPSVISERCCHKLTEFYDVVRQEYGLFPLDPVLPLTEEESMTPITDRMNMFICEYDLLPQDSLNLAIADAYDVRNIITFDSDLSRAANRFRIYIPNPH